MKRLGLVTGCLLVGTFVGAYFFHTEDFAPRLNALIGLNSRSEPAHPAEEGVAKGAGHQHGHEDKSSAAVGAETDGDHEKDNGKLAMAAEQIDRSKIAVKAAEAGLLRKRLRVPGTIIPDRNRVGRVPSKVVGTVAELKKGLGDLGKSR